MRPPCPTKMAMKAKQADLLISFDYKRVIRESTFFNLMFNKENKIEFDFNKIERDIASLISENRVNLLFEKNLTGCIQYFQFKGKKAHEGEAILNKVIKRIDNVIPLTNDLKEMFKAE